MKYEILINSIIRLPLDKAFELFSQYQEEIGFKTFAQQQRVLDILSHKSNYNKMIKQEVFMELAVYLRFMVKGEFEDSDELLECIKGFPMVVWAECIASLKPSDIILILDNYSKVLTPELLETFIINLPDNLQIECIQKYKSQLDCNSSMFCNFYYSVCEGARIKLKQYYPDAIGDDILKELEDVDEYELPCTLSNNLERLNEIDSDELVEFILLKTNNWYVFNKFFDLFKEKINDCSDMKFQLLITRYMYRFLTYASCNDSEHDFVKFSKRLSDLELFLMFKNKFRSFGPLKTLEIFNSRSSSLCESVLLEMIEFVYKDKSLFKYVNAESIVNIMQKFVKRCNDKEYALEDLEKLVCLAGSSNEKLIHDDYIEAMIALGQLMKKNVVRDSDSLFTTLFEKFTKDLLSRCKKDKTCSVEVSLKGVFYRLVKGSLAFDKVYTIKTYKGLIYLSKSGNLVDDVDYVVKHLSDEQVAELNITPMLRWTNQIIRNNKEDVNIPLVERMGLQLLLFFGKEKARYLMEAGMRLNRMENIFDGLQYANISVNDDGTSNINEEVVNYLFGNGMMKESNSAINRMIRGEIPRFEKFFAEFCNLFEEVKVACNGVLSIKRIINHFVGIEFPIELKPDEIEFKQALSEISTTSVEALLAAITLCKQARNRGYSSIPKVEGKLGDFTYEILDLKNPLAVAVGYLSHCCFTIGGDSYSALKHSMRSTNGRTFVVYYKGNFLTQSWVWRNGDVVCFDSVEAGSPCHGMYKDDIKLVDVYKKVAREMLYISECTEDCHQKIKVVTVGKSDYKFEGLELLNGVVPRPLENDVYVYDSSVQHILAGSMPEEVRYGGVDVRYKDPRKRIISINDVSAADIDTLDEMGININSLRYQTNKEECPANFSNYYKVVSGDGWYILFNNDGTIESGALKDNEETIAEYNRYLSRYTDSNISYGGQPFVKQLKPLTGNKI